ncbi:hypothetical protein FKM82_026789 [Ascaphus truei]
MNESYSGSSNNASMEELNGTVESQSRIRRSAYALPLTTISLAICVIGLVGNGIVLWFFCFKIKRSQFTIYILNLAVADFTFLTGLLVLLLYIFCLLNKLKKSMAVLKYIILLTGLLYNLGFNTGIYILMAIGLERCLAVLYPFWYRCQRPKKQSTYVCTMFWMLSALVTGLESFLCSGGQQYLTPGSESCTKVYFFTSALYLIVVPIMLLSSLMLLLHIQKASEHCHPPRLYIVIVASVTIFLISVVPARVLGLLIYYNILYSDTFLLAFFYVTSVCSAINCSANPYIYMLVGRWRNHMSEESSIKQSLETVFNEDTERQPMGQC